MSIVLSVSWDCAKTKNCIIYLRGVKGIDFNKGHALKPLTTKHPEHLGTP